MVTTQPAENGGATRSDAQRRRRAGGHWRFLAHEAPNVGQRMYGDPIALESTTLPPSEFDELVVGQWLHIEQMDTGQWWMNIGGLTVNIRVDRDGRPVRVMLEEDDLISGCEYDLPGFLAPFVEGRTA